MTHYKKCKIELTNSFHNTEVELWARFRAGFDQILITHGQVKRARRVLCGIAECTCGDVAGCKPNQVQDNPAPGGLYEVYAKPVKVLDGLYDTKWDDGTGRLIKL